MTNQSLSRRTFLAASGMALGAGIALNRRAFGANDRISLAIIGAGDRGTSHIADIAKLKDSHNVAITAVCDVWRVNLDTAAERVTKWFGAAPFTTTRFGEVLVRDDVDAVVIATPDFGHTPIMLEALKAGKDVYVEKPMSLEMDMANEALDLARANGRVVQVGTQKRSEGKWRAAREFLSGQGLGTLTRVSSSVCFNHPRWARDVSDC